MFDQQTKHNKQTARIVAKIILERKPRKYRLLTILTIRPNNAKLGIQSTIINKLTLFFTHPRD